MSKKLEICSATYNITLNQDANDVFRTGCAHLYHFLHVNGYHDGRSAECKPMMLKMHLELNEFREAEEQIVEPKSSNNDERSFVEQLEAKFQSLKDSLQANNEDAVNKIIEKMFEKNLSNNLVNKATDIGNNTIDHETNNALLSISDNDPKQSVQQLEAKLKSLEDALQENNVDAVNKIIERIEKLEKNFTNIFVNKATDIGNNIIDHERYNALLSSSNSTPRQSVQQLDKEVKALKYPIEQLELNKAVNDTADIGNPTTHDNCTEKPQQQQTNKHNSSQKLSNNGNNGSDDHSDGKEYQMIPKEKREIQFDRENLIAIWNINDSDSSLKTAVRNVIKYAKEIDLSLTRDQIKHIDVRVDHEDVIAYYVFFRTRAITEAFLKKRDILRRFPHFLNIGNASEYKSVFIRNFKSSCLSEDCAILNVIGLAKQMSLALTRDQISYIDVFKLNQNCLVYRVCFHTTEVQNEFLKKSHVLKEFPETKSLEIY